MLFYFMIAFKFVLCNIPASQQMSGLVLITSVEKPPAAPARSVFRPPLHGLFIQRAFLKAGLGTDLFRCGRQRHTALRKL